MSYKARFIVLLTGVISLMVVPSATGQFWDFPPLPPPEQYGNLIINRISEKSNVMPVTFSHWIHRQKYTCRVCHFELEFNFRVNTTEITEEANRAGKFCGASGCHDGRASFGHEDKDDCMKCHNGDITYGKEKFSRLIRLPKARMGNGIDWTKAIARGMIRPLNYLTIRPPEEIAFDKELLLHAEWFNIPPAVFPHKDHIRWLDCNNCHPDIFNIKKKGTHFRVTDMIKGEFCGVCHLKVAFPLNDCKRCHPAMRH